MQKYIIGLLSFLFFFQYAYTHDVSIVATSIDLQASGTNVQLYAKTDITYDLGEDEPVDGFGYYFSDSLILRNQDTPCIFTLEKVKKNESRSGATDISGHFSCEKEVTSLNDIYISSTLFDDLGATDWSTYVHFIIGETGTDIVLDLDKNYFDGGAENEKTNSTDTETTAPSTNALLSNIEGSTNTASFLRTMKNFILIGIEHILGGMDHILFVIALIFIVQGYKNILMLVSGFTIAHSVTLILAGMGLISLTAKIVEPIIALSIIYMAGYNCYVIYHHKEKTIDIMKRFWITVGFGLFHGLGFAGSLSSTVIPEQYFLSSLIAFNVGVEIGQLMIIILTVPLIGLLLKSRKKISRKTLLSVSAIVLAISIYWFIERIL